MLLSIPANDLRQLISECVNDCLQKAATAQTEEKMLSPKQALKLFNPAPSIATLAAWEKRGLLKKYYLGGRTFFKQSEIIEAAKQLKKYKRQA